MSQFRTMILLLLLCQALTVFAGVTLESVPPVVVETSPKAGTADVDTTVSEVRVSFSKDMMTDNMWSVMMVDGAAFPKIVGALKFINKRTFVMPVQLMPNKTYATRFNSQKGHAFKDASGKSAESYLLVFKTK